MRIYSDPETNRIANEIRDDFEELGQSMGAMMGYKTDVDISVAQKILTRLMENPIPFAIEFLNRNKDRLNRLKLTVNRNENTFKELNDTVASGVIGILNLPINDGKMMAFTSDFRKHLNDPEVIKIKKNLSESAWILSSLRELETNREVQNQIITLLGTITQLEKKYKPLSGCFIATAVYRDYNAPEVIELRLFRDKHLSNYKIGRLIIDSYYEISPILIQKFGHNHIFKILSKALIYNAVKLIQLFNYH